MYNDDAIRIRIMTSTLESTAPPPRADLIDSPTELSENELLKASPSSRKSLHLGGTKSKSTNYQFGRR